MAPTTIVYPGAPARSRFEGDHGHSASAAARAKSSATVCLVRYLWDIF